MNKRNLSQTRQLPISVAPGVSLHPAEARFVSRFGWLDSRHSFAFGHHHDPERVGFGPLRVINDDRVAAGAGFGAHGHRDMEILSIVLEGALEHRDSLGHGSVVHAGEIQRMSAGRGVQHSEFNASSSQPLRFLQIWIVPHATGLEPGYEQQAIDLENHAGTWRLLASGDGRDGSVTINRDVALYGAHLAQGERLVHRLRPQRRYWLHVAEGEAMLDEQSLRSGDGLQIEAEALDALVVEGQSAHTQLLLFELD